MYEIQHCFICHPSDSTVSEDVSEDAGMEPIDPGIESRMLGSNPECWDRTKDAGIEPRLLGSNRNVNNIEERPPLPAVLGHLFDEGKTTHVYRSLHRSVAETSLRLLRLQHSGGSTKNKK
jgi:hypothetical protein